MVIGRAAFAYPATMIIVFTYEKTMITSVLS